MSNILPLDLYLQNNPTPQGDADFAVARGLELYDLSNLQESGVNAEKVSLKQVDIQDLDVYYTPANQSEAVKLDWQALTDVEKTNILGNGSYTPEGGGAVSNLQINVGDEKNTYFIPLETLKSSEKYQEVVNSVEAAAQTGGDYEKGVAQRLRDIKVDNRLGETYAQVEGAGSGEQLIGMDIEDLIIVQREAGIKDVMLDVQMDVFGLGEKTSIGQYGILPQDIQNLINEAEAAKPEVKNVVQEGGLGVVEDVETGNSVTNFLVNSLAELAEGTGRALESGAGGVFAIVDLALGAVKSLGEAVGKNGELIGQALADPDKTISQVLSENPSLAETFNKEFAGTKEDVKNLFLLQKARLTPYENITSEQKEELYAAGFSEDELTKSALNFDNAGINALGADTRIMTNVATLLLGPAKAAQIARSGLLARAISKTGKVIPGLSKLSSVTKQKIVQEGIEQMARQAPQVGVAAGKGNRILGVAKSAQASKVGFDAAQEFSEGDNSLLAALSEAGLSAVDGAAALLSGAKIELTNTAVNTVGQQDNKLGRLTYEWYRALTPGLAAQEYEDFENWRLENPEASLSSYEGPYNGFAAHDGTIGRLDSIGKFAINTAAPMIDAAISSVLVAKFIPGGAGFKTAAGRRAGETAYALNYYDQFSRLEGTDRGDVLGSVFMSALAERFGNNIGNKIMVRNQKAVADQILGGKGVTDLVKQSVQQGFDGKNPVFSSVFGGLRAEAGGNALTSRFGALNKTFRDPLFAKSFRVDFGANAFGEGISEGVQSWLEAIGDGEGATTDIISNAALGSVLGALLGGTIGLGTTVLMSPASVENYVTKEPGVENTPAEEAQRQERVSTIRQEQAELDSLYEDGVFRDTLGFKINGITRVGTVNKKDGIIWSESEYAQQARTENINGSLQMAESNSIKEYLTGNNAKNTTSILIKKADGGLYKYELSSRAEDQFVILSEDGKPVPESKTKNLKTLQELADANIIIGSLNSAGDLIEQQISVQPQGVEAVSVKQMQLEPTGNIIGLEESQKVTGVKIFNAANGEIAISSATETVKKPEILDFNNTLSNEERETIRNNPEQFPEVDPETLVDSEETTTNNTQDAQNTNQDRADEVSGQQASDTTTQTEPSSSSQSPSTTEEASPEPRVEGPVQQGQVEDSPQAETTPDTSEPKKKAPKKVVKKKAAPKKVKEKAKTKPVPKKPKKTSTPKKVTKTTPNTTEFFDPLESAGVNTTVGIGRTVVTDKAFEGKDGEVETEKFEEVDEVTPKKSKKKTVNRVEYSLTELEEQMDIAVSEGDDIRAAQLSEEIGRKLEDLGIRFSQKNINTLRKLPLDVIATKVSKTMGVKVHTSKETFDKNLNLAIKLYTTSKKEGVVYGFTDGQSIFIDPTVAGGGTVLHEASHIWLDSVKVADPVMYTKLEEAVKNTKVYKDLRAKRKNLSTEFVVDEALAQIVEQYGRDPLSLGSKIRTAIKKFWERVGELLGIDPKMVAMRNLHTYDMNTLASFVKAQVLGDFYYKTIPAQINDAGETVRYSADDSYELSKESINDFGQKSGVLKKPLDDNKTTADNLEEIKQGLEAIRENRVELEKGVNPFLYTFKTMGATVAHIAAPEFIGTIAPAVNPLTATALATESDILKSVSTGVDPRTGEGKTLMDDWAAATGQAKVKLEQLRGLAYTTNENVKKLVKGSKGKLKKENIENIFVLAQQTTIDEETGNPLFNKARDRKTGKIRDILEVKRIPPDQRKKKTKISELDILASGGQVVNDYELMVGETTIPFQITKTAEGSTTEYTGEFDPDNFLVKQVMSQVDSVSDPRSVGATLVGTTHKVVRGKPLQGTGVSVSEQRDFYSEVETKLNNGEYSDLEIALAMEYRKLWDGVGSLMVDMDMLPGIQEGFLPTYYTVKDRKGLDSNQEGGTDRGYSYTFVQENEAKGSVDRRLGPSVDKYLRNLHQKVQKEKLIDIFKTDKSILTLDEYNSLKNSVPRLRLLMKDTASLEAAAKSQGKTPSELVAEMEQDIVVAEALMKQIEKKPVVVNNREYHMFSVVQSALFAAEVIDTKPENTKAIPNRVKFAISTRVLAELSDRGRNNPGIYAADKLMELRNIERTLTFGNTIENLAIQAPQGILKAKILTQLNGVLSGTVSLEEGDFTDGLNLQSLKNALAGEIGQTAADDVFGSVTGAPPKTEGGAAGFAIKVTKVADKLTPLLETIRVAQTKMIDTSHTMTIMSFTLSELSKFKKEGTKIGKKELEIAVGNAVKLSTEFFPAQDSKGTRPIALSNLRRVPIAGKVLALYTSFYTWGLNKSRKSIETMGEAIKKKNPKLFVLAASEFIYSNTIMTMTRLFMGKAVIPALGGTLGTLAVALGFTEDDEESDDGVSDFKREQPPRGFNPIRLFKYGENSLYVDGLRMDISGYGVNNQMREVGRELLRRYAPEVADKIGIPEEGSRRSAKALNDAQVFMTTLFPPAGLLLNPDQFSWKKITNLGNSLDQLVQLLPGDIALKEVAAITDFFINGQYGDVRANPDDPVQVALGKHISRLIGLDVLPDTVRITNPETGKVEDVQEQTGALMGILQVLTPADAQVINDSYVEMGREATRNSTKNRYNEYIEALDKATGARDRGDEKADEYLKEAKELGKDLESFMIKNNISLEQVIGEKPEGIKSIRDITKLDSSRDLPEGVPRSTNTAPTATGTSSSGGGGSSSKKVTSVKRSKDKSADYLEKQRNEQSKNVKPIKPKNIKAEKVKTSLKKVSKKTPKSSGKSSFKPIVKPIKIDSLSKLKKPKTSLAKISSANKQAKTGGLSRSKTIKKLPKTKKPTTFNV